MKHAPPADPLSDIEAAELFESVFLGARGVLIAVSGGPDSMALMGLMARWRGRPPIVAATVDHGLRFGSADEARLVGETAQRLGVPHRILAWTGAKPGSGLQEAAREARYTLLAREARALGFTHIATAHHADDQAETVLMRLAAGSGVAGLGAMRAISERGGVFHARPLLAIPKARLSATLTELALPCVEDPSNVDPRFGRARMRTALATLAAEGLTVVRLTRLAARAARADDALREAARVALAAADPKVTDCIAQADWTVLTPQPAEIRLRALSELVRSAGLRTDRVGLDKLEALLSALDAAAANGRRLRRSIGGLIATLQSNGRLTIAAAPARRRGAKSGTPLGSEEP